MAKMKYTNLFLKYHCSINAFSELMRKTMLKKHGINQSEFATLSLGFLMEHKKGFFTRKFLVEIRKVDRSVVHRTMDGLLNKGFIKRDGRVKRLVRLVITPLGYKILEDYSKVYMRIIEDFEEEHWKLNIY